ncbi:MAG: hypothetical protein IJP29_07570 [Lachnospiraceae bacterium]|nr:hypothetical protein [Lachnospiraceae bacterium]
MPYIIQRPFGTDVMKQSILMMILLILLLIFNDAVIAGAQNGLLLWYQTLIPSLLPFILVTNALSEMNTYQQIASRFSMKNIGRFYELLAVVMGNLCGYPIGAKIINDFTMSQCLSPKRANELLAMASQASPMFLIGYVFRHFLEEKLPLVIFLTAIYLPVCVYYFLFRTFSKNQSSGLVKHYMKKIPFRDTFMHSVEIMVTIGVYVILFSILLSILLPLCSNHFVKLPLFFLEITTGIKLISDTSYNESVQIALLCALSSFGGLCSAYQIKGVLQYKNAEIKRYLIDKCILSSGTFFIVYLYCIYAL